VIEADGASANAFANYLRREGSQYEVVGWKPLAGGRAAETVLATVADGSRERRWVLRIEPDSGPTHGVALNTQEHFELLQFLFQAEVAAPQPILMEVDTAVLGRPFMVTDFTPGDVPSPWSAAGRQQIGAEPGRTTIAQNMAAALAKIHALTADGLPAFLSAPQMDRSPNAEVVRWTGLVDRSAFADDPLVGYASHWLRSRLIHTKHKTLVHGDFRLGNLVLQEGEVLGVLDWEMSGIGDPVSDLALLCCPPVARDWERCGLGTVDALVTAYEGESGRAVDRDHLHALTVLATFKIVTLWVNGANGRVIHSPVALRNAVNAVASRSMLIDALRLDLPAGAPDRHAGARAEWFRDLRSMLASDRKSESELSPSVVRLANDIPPPDGVVVDWFDHRIGALGRSWGVAVPDGPVASRLTILIDASFESDRHVTPYDRAALEGLVAGAGHLDAAIFPWECPRVPECRTAIEV